MSELKASLLLNMSGNIERQAERYGRAITNMADRSVQQLGTLRRGVSLMSSGLDKLGNRYSGFITGAGGAAATKYVVGIEERMERLGVAADLNSEQVEKLQQNIFDISQQRGIKINNTELLAAIEEIVEKTGDLDFAKNNLESLALAISATGAEGGKIGGIAAEFQKMGLVDIRKPLDVLITQGKAGAFTLAELAALGPRVVSAYSATGRIGEIANREMGAVLQVIRQGTGSSEQAATSFEALLRSLQSLDKVALLKQRGIEVFDTEKLKQGEKVMRPLTELMVEIVKRTQGDSGLINKILGSEEAGRAFNAMVSEFKRTGDMESIKRFYEVHADGSALLADSARIAGTAAGGLRRIVNTGQQFADLKLAAPINELATALDNLSDSELNSILDKALNLAEVVGGIWALNKGAKWLGQGYKAVQKVRGVAATSSAASLARQARVTAGLVGGVPLRALPLLGVSGMATAGATVAGTGYAAYHGTQFGLDQLGFYKTSIADSIGRAVAQALSAIGSDNAREALQAELRISFDREGQPLLKQLSAVPGLSVDVEGGLIMGGNG